jgi:hypothetical protein
MRVTIRISADRKGGPSTEGEITVSMDKTRKWICLDLDSTDVVSGYSMRPAEARKLASAIEQAAGIAEKQNA